MHAYMCSISVPNGHKGKRRTIDPQNLELQMDVKQFAGAMNSI